MDIPGKSDDILMNIDTPDSIRIEVESYLSKIVKYNHNKNANKRKAVIFELMEFILSCPILTMEDFLWHWNITCRLTLLNGLGCEGNFYISQLLQNTFQTITAQCQKCSVSAHVIAKTLFQFLDDDDNLLHVVFTFLPFCLITKNVGGALIWAGLFRIFDLEFKMLRLHPVCNLEHLLETYTPEDALDDKPKLIRFLKYLSVINHALLDEDSIYLNEENEVCDDFGFLLYWLNRIKFIIYTDKVSKLDAETILIQEMLDLNILNTLEVHKWD